MNQLAFALLAALSLASFGCKKKSEGTDMLKKLADYTDRMCACTDAKCVDGVNAELKKWSESQPKNQKAALSDEDKAKSDELAKKLVECMNRVGATGSAGTPPPAPPTPAGSATGSGSASADLPPPCVDYKATIDRLSTCEKMDAAQRDAFKNAYDAAAKNWSTFTPSQRDSIAENCKQANEAVVAAAKKQCGW